MVKSAVLLGLVAAASAGTFTVSNDVAGASVWVRRGAAAPYQTTVTRAPGANGAHTITFGVSTGVSVATAPTTVYTQTADTLYSYVIVNEATASATPTGFTASGTTAGSGTLALATSSTLTTAAAATQIGQIFIDGAFIPTGVIVGYTVTVSATPAIVYTGTLSNTATTVSTATPVAFASSQGYVAIPVTGSGLVPYTVNFTNGTVAGLQTFSARATDVVTTSFQTNATTVQGTVGAGALTAIITAFGVAPAPLAPVAPVVVPVPVLPNVTVECAVAAGLSPVLFCSADATLANPCIGGSTAARLTTTLVLCVPPNAQVSPFEVRAILAIIAAGDLPRSGFQSFVTALVAADLGVYAANVTTNPVAEGYFQEQGFATYAAPSAVNPAAARVLVAVPTLGVQLIICTQVLAVNQIACLRRGLREVRRITGVENFADNGICAVDGILVPCDLTSSSSKKGLLGLLGLLGLIPLLLSLSLCCLLCLCRRKKVENEVAFATFDPAVAPVSTFVAPVSATCTGFGAPLGSGIPVTIA